VPSTIVWRANRQVNGRLAGYELRPDRGADEVDAVGVELLAHQQVDRTDPRSIVIFSVFSTSFTSTNLSIPVDGAT